MLRLAVFAAIAVATVGSVAGDEAVIERLEAAIRFEMADKRLPALSIALVREDRVIWAAGFGFQDAEKSVPASAVTVYRVGSVSKLFTDIAIMQLVERGELDLDVPIQGYLPELNPQNPFGTPLTLRQMMSHRSGLVRESPVGNYFDPSEPTLAETVASLNETALVYPPETRTKYSNAAIAVVGAVLETRLDVSHPDYVQRSILDPLGMANSSFVVTNSMAPRLATGWMHTYDGRRFFPAPDFLLGSGPAGNLYASVDDLAKFMICLFDEGAIHGDQLLKPETFRLMTTPITDSKGEPQNFGIGFQIQELDGHRKVGHGGAVYGFSTQLEAIPQRRLGVSAASSLDGTNGVVQRLSDFALRLMLAEQDKKPLPSYTTTESIPPHRSRELVGTYRLVGSNGEANGDGLVQIVELNGEVMMQYGSFRRRLRAISDDGRIVIDDAFGFGTDVSLQGTDQLVIGDVAYMRTQDEPYAEPSDRWKGLIGEYGWDHNVLYILEDHGVLFALIEWFYYYPLKEVDNDTFEFPDYGLYHGEGLRFHRDSSGNATHVVAAEVEFARRPTGMVNDEVFRINPVRPIDELRESALAASPPEELGGYRQSELVDLATLDASIGMDIRYATTNNFTGAVFYKQPRAFMQRPAAEALVRASEKLKARGLGLLVHDAYRPWHVTKMFWDATPSEMKDFVANPSNGSRHNRGCAVDITLYDLNSSEPIKMVAGYDEFSSRSFPLYPGGTTRQRWYRDLLRQTMEAEDFTVYEYEWWHFDYKDWQQYRIGNLTFEEIDLDQR